MVIILRIALSEIMTNFLWIIAIGFLKTVFEAV